MSTITADPTLEKWFGQLSDVTEIRNANGNVIGTFTPRQAAEDDALYQNVMKHFDPSETERILREEKGKGASLADFWQKMEANAKP